MSSHSRKKIVLKGSCQRKQFVDKIDRTDREMGKVLPYQLFLCTIFFLFKGCLGTLCKYYYTYGGTSYTYLICSYGCCGPTYDQYCCYDSSWSSWSSTSGVSVGVIAGCSIAGIVIFVSIVSGIIAAVYKATRGNRMVRPGVINNANIIARTDASGQHPTNLSQNQLVSNSAYPPTSAGPSQIPSNYMYPPPPVYPPPVPPPYEPQAPQK